MVNAAREPCMATWRWTTPGWVAHNQGSAEAQLKGRKAALVLVAVEKPGMRRANPDGGAPDLRRRPSMPVKQHIAPARRSTPMRTELIDCRDRGQARGAAQASRSEFRRGAVSVVRWRTRDGNLQQWLIGTYTASARRSCRSTDECATQPPPAADSGVRRCSGWAAVARPTYRRIRGARDLIER